MSSKKKVEEKGSISKVTKPKQQPSNLFQNDGSFMEMFKKMQEHNQEGSSPAAVPIEQKPSTVEEIPVSTATKEPTVEAAYYSTQTMYYKDEAEGASSSKKPQYQGIIGKRKTLMRSVELREKRKKRREELEGKQNEEQKEQKSSAWKAYMAEVKAYEERSLLASQLKKMDTVQLRHPVAEVPSDNAVPRRMRPKSASYVALRSAVYQLTSMADFKLEKIGSGFFADVYKVRHKTTGEVMVLKMNKNSKTSKAMLSEIQLMNRLSHPNILRFKGSCVHEGHLHALTEYINGGSLEELLLDKEVKLSWSVRLKIIKDIVNGMVYLHSKNVFHRDLNPKNCLIQREKDGKLRTVVADFGLAAKIKQRRRRSHTEAVGSPYWMAPELLKGKSYCEQADVFSFGITLAEIIARIPADPDIMPRTMKYGLDSMAMREMCADCPEQLMELLEKCCQIDPDDRPTFEEISDILSTIQIPEEEEGEGGEVNTITGLPPLPPPILDSTESSSHHDRDLRPCISEPSILLTDLEDDNRSCGSEGEERLIVEQRHPLQRQRLLSSLGSSTGSSCGSIPETGIPEEGREGFVMGGVHHLEIAPGDAASENAMDDQTPKQLENDVGVANLEGSSNEPPIKVMLKFDEGSPSPKSKCLFRRTSMEGLALSNGRKHSLQKSHSLNVDGRNHASNHTHSMQENGLLHPLCATSPSGSGLSSSVQTLLAEDDGVLCSDVTTNGKDGAGLGGGDSGIDPGDVDVFKFPSPPVGQVSPAPPTQGDHTPLCVSPAPSSPITAIPANGYTATPTLTPSNSTPNQHCSHYTYTPQATPLATPSTANAHSPAHSGFSYSCTSSEDMTDFDGYGYSTPNNRCSSPMAQSWASSEYSFSLPPPSTPWAPPSSPMPPPPTCHTPHSLPTSPTHFYQHHHQPRPSTSSTSKGAGRKNQHHRQSLEVTGTHYPSPNNHNSNITSCMRKSGSKSCRNSALFPELHDETRRGSGGELRGQGRQGSYEDDETYQRKSVHFEDLDEERLFGNDCGFGATDYRNLLSATKSSLTSPNRPRSKSSPRRQRKISAYSPQGLEEGVLQGGEYGIGLELDTTDPHSFKFYKIAQKSNMRLSNSAPDLSKLLNRLPPPVL